MNVVYASARQARRPALADQHDRARTHLSFQTRRPRLMRLRDGLGRADASRPKKVESGQASGSGMNSGSPGHGVEARLAPVCLGLLDTLGP